MNSLYRSLVYDRTLRDLQKRCKTADKLNKQECQRCGFCCWVQPPRLSKADLKRLAKHKRMTHKEFFKQFCAVHTVEGILAPILLRRHQKGTGQGGKWISDCESWSIESPCIFAAKTRPEGKGAKYFCQIHNIKPAECENHKCWGKKEFKAQEWTKSDLKKLGYIDYNDEYGEDDGNW